MKYNMTTGRRLPYTDSDY